MSEDANPTSRSEQRVTFHYIKSPGHQTYHVDGAIGGGTPRGLLYIHLFSERRPLPQLMEQIITEEGEFGDFVRVDSKQGVIRDVACGVIMDLPAAHSFHQWLGEKIEELQRILMPPRPIEDVGGAEGSAEHTA